MRIVPPASGRSLPGTLTTEQLLALPATWFNVDQALHHLWGQAHDREYDKQSWHAFHELLKRLKARSV